MLIRSSLKGTKRERLYVPSWEAKKVLHRFHPLTEEDRRGIGMHQGVHRTYELVSFFYCRLLLIYFFLSKIAQEHYGITEEMVRQHIKQCRICEQHNPLTSPTPDVVPIRSAAINERWVLDTTYVLEFADENGGFIYIGVVIDHFSKYVFIFPLQDRTAEAVRYDSFIFCFTNTLLCSGRNN